VAPKLADDAVATDGRARPPERAFWRDAGTRAILVGKSLKWLAESKTQGGNNG
jgi:hypothetical protein